MPNFVFSFFHPLKCACVRHGVAAGGQAVWEGSIKHKTAGSGHGVAGLNLPPGNPFRGQVCLLKERQSSRFGGFFPPFGKAAVQDIPEINYQLWLIAIYHISWPAE